MGILIGIICGIAGLVLGYVIGSLAMEKKATPYKVEIARLESQLVDKEKMFEETLLIQQQNSRDSLEAMQGRFDETVAKMKAEIENLTGDLLKKREQEFSERSKSDIAQILEPLNLNINEMRKAVNENTLRHTQMGGELSNNIRLVMQHSDAARQSAEKLAEALRGGGKVQGDWGEVVLSELLESQGLVKGRHFDTQATLTDEAGNTLLSDETGNKMRPDVILHLDNERDVVIDAKVSLTAFIDYVNAETEETRNLALKRHIDSIEKHVRDLASKNYSAYIRPPKRSVDYVIMFVPNSTALYLATNSKDDLWRNAMGRGVYIADEHTLYAALRIINLTWRQITQAENHEKVYKLADEMLDRVARFMEKFTAVGNKLKDADKAYEEALAKLRDSGQSIPATCRKLVSLGAKTKKTVKGVDKELLGIGNPADPE